ncbi:MAG: hypothetical protein MPF33_04385 [Candidatus Aramenus sp.]|jgi:hypothetical protein|nr:hypothetical protein [Candidatus Aramenus sp.]
MIPNGVEDLLFSFPLGKRVLVHGVFPYTGFETVTLSDAKGCVFDSAVSLHAILKEEDPISVIKKMVELSKGLVFLADERRDESKLRRITFYTARNMGFEAYDLGDWFALVRLRAMD